MRYEVKKRWLIESTVSEVAKLRTYLTSYLNSGEAY